MNGKRRHPKSVLDTEKGVCYLCGKVGETELHHCVFGSGYRKISDRLGLVVYLCHECHQGTEGVHGRDGDDKNRRLKREAQEAWEKTHSHSEWMQIVGRNFL